MENTASGAISTIQLNDTTSAATYTNVGTSYRRGCETSAPSAPADRTADACTWGTGGDSASGTYHTAYGGPCSASFAFTGTYGGMIAEVSAPRLA